MPQHQFVLIPPNVVRLQEEVILTKDRVRLLLAGRLLLLDGAAGLYLVQRFRRDHVVNGDTRLGLVQLCGRIFVLK